MRGSGSRVRTEDRIHFLKGSQGNAGLLPLGSHGAEGRSCRETQRTQISARRGQRGLISASNSRCSRLVGRTRVDGEQFLPFVRKTAVKERAETAVNAIPAPRALDIADLRRNSLIILEVAPTDSICEPKEVVGPVFFFFFLSPTNQPVFEVPRFRRPPKTEKKNSKTLDGDFWISAKLEF